MAWTNKLEEELILLVQEHECLYNLQHADYDDNIIKDNIWRGVGTKLNMAGEC